MQLFNSLGKKKENFTPVRPGEVNIYVCGITAYDLCHIGHARSAIVFDTLVRHLRHSGLKVNFVRNITDVDDKIIARANKEGRDWREVAETYTTAFHEDMERLGCLPSDHEPHATDAIMDIQKICQTLIDNGKAYPTQSGDVYFRVRAHEPYGKLSGRSLDDMLAGARVAPGEEKEDPLDFALWKAAKPGEPAWDSPWGKGRPGWHIECSAMSKPYLPLDIHGGGQDLVFPHHENEIAQSEAALDCQLARFWVHNGFVRINKEKMSKSLGNFKTIRDILEHYLPETLRFFLLGKHYRSPVDFDEQSMKEAEKAQSRVYTAILQAQNALARTNWKKKPIPDELESEFSQAKAGFTRAMDDDLNTAEALGHVFTMVRIANHLLEDKGLKNAEATRQCLEDLVGQSQQWSGELGIFGQEPAAFLDDLRNIRAKRCDLDLELVNNLLEKRKAARASKDFVASDAIRDELQNLGVVVRDTAEGQTWDLE